MDVRLTWDTLNGIINPKQRDGSFERRLKTTNLAHGRFQDTGIYVISYLTIQQVKSIAEISLLGISSVRLLGCIVTGAKFCDKLGRVLCCVDGKRFWYYQKGTSEFCNRQLLS